MGKYSKLIKNSGIFAIANMGSSLVSFLLVRFYTELLTTEQYGTIDFLTTVSSMLIPFLTLAIVEAVLRFSIDNDDKTGVLSGGLKVVFIGNVIAFLIGPIVIGKTSYASYCYWVLCLILSTSLNNIAAQFVRGIGRVRTFALCGVLKTFVLVSCNIIFLVGFALKVEGYLLSMIISELVSFVFLFTKAKLWNYISLRSDKYVLKEMVIYSLPLMPSSLAWWVMNASDKYMLIAFIGINANGLYAVAHKLPTLINLCNSLFFQAWQLSAIEEAGSESKQTFYSNVFNSLAMFLFIACSGLLFVMKPLMKVLVASSYGDAWKYTPFLVLSMVFSAFSSFLGTNYTVTKKTGGALKTTIIGAAVNVVLNYLLIKIWGINGAAFATMISFLTMWIIRAIDTREFIEIKYQYKKMIVSFLAVFCQAIVVAQGYNFAMFSGGISFAIVVLIYLPEIVKLLKNTIAGIKHGDNDERKIEKDNI